MDQREVGDRLEIHELLTAYVDALDDRDWDAFRSVFSDGAVVDYTSSGGPRGGVEDAIPWIRDGLANFDITHHLITNVRIEIDGDEARARCRLFNPMTRGGSIVVVGGGYRDVLRRTKDGWRFAERIQIGQWMGTMPAVEGWPPRQS